MLFSIKITATPSSTFGSDEPEVLREAKVFGGFRSPTDRYRWGRGNVPTITYAHEGRNPRQPATWTTREAAERNLARLTERGYVAEVVVV